MLLQKVPEGVKLERLGVQKEEEGGEVRKTGGAERRRRGVKLVERGVKSEARGLVALRPSLALGATLGAAAVTRLAPQERA